MRALSPVLLVLATWAGLPGRILASTGAGTGTSCFYLPTGNALSSRNTPSHAQMGEDRPLDSLPGSTLASCKSLMSMAGQAMPSCHPADGRIRPAKGRISLKYGGIGGKGARKPRYTHTAFGKIPRAPLRAAQA